MSKIKVQFIDPPQGWKFGFPRPLVKNVKVKKWLIESGYPEELIKEFGDHFYCRYYILEISEEELLEKFNMSKEDVTNKDETSGWYGC